MSRIHGLEVLEQQDIEQLSTVTGLTQVLAFADAVGSYEGVLKAACSQVQQLKFVVQLPEQTLQLPVAGHSYHFRVNHQLVQCSMAEDTYIGDPLASIAQQCDLQQQVAQQTAALLRLAHVLRLQPLLDVLHEFVMLNASHSGSPLLLSGVAGLVFSDAVLGAGLGSSTLSKEAYVSSALSLPCSLTPGFFGHGSLLKPVGRRTYDCSSDTIRFDAQLLRDFAGAKAGDTVEVTLDLFGCLDDGTQAGAVVQLGTRVVDHEVGEEFSLSVKLEVQLLFGYHFPRSEGLRDFLQVHAA